MPFTKSKPNNIMEAVSSIPLKRKTIMKGSAGKVVDRETLPEMPAPVIKEEILDTTKLAEAAAKPEEQKPSGAYVSLMKVSDWRIAGDSISQTAYKMGKDEAWVKQSLAIIDRLPKSAHDAISKGKFSRTAALQLLYANPASLEKIIEGALKIADIENGKL
jgi:hypothetical protein